MLNQLTQYHISVEEGEFRTSLHNTAHLYLFDLDEHILVTFEKLKYAERTAKKFSGVVEKTPRGTYRIISS